jgi:SMI1 / KNR4 family (SUKH-1)
MIYLEKVKARVDELHVLYPDKLVPCTAEEVERLEHKIGRSLPEAYREFLLWMGHWTGGLWRGTNWLYEDLDAIQEDAVELMQRDAFPVTLPPDAFVFLMHAHYQFAFFRTSEGDDPPVYMYVETDEEIALKISDSHYSDFLLDLVESDEKMIEEIERLHPEEAKKDPYFARRVLDNEERPPVRAKEPTE